MSVTEITTDPPGVGIVGGRGKSAGQVAAMVGELLERSAGPVFVTGTTPDQRAAIRAAWPEARYHARSGLTVARPVRVPLAAHVAVVTAGTSDLTVAEEAADAARGLGLTVTTIADVGVAGLHRLLAHRELLQGVDCAIVAGGMAALVAMVSSCTPGVAVVNVDDGLGAALVAWRILRACGSRRSGRMP